MPVTEPAPDGTADRTALDPQVSGSADDARVRRVLLVLAPAVVYLAARQIGVLILLAMAAANGSSVRAELTSWDGQWYLAIAADGYGGVPGGLVDAHGTRTPDTPLAFFPGYPVLVGWVAELPLLGVESAAFLVTTACGVVAAYGVSRIGRDIRGGSRTVGLVLVALFAAAPMGVVLSMTYSEALFCALAAWSLAFVLRRQWLWAASCCALAGLVRPTAVALIVVVSLAAAVAAARRKDDARVRSSAALACALAPLGLVGYLLWVGWQVRPGAGLVTRLSAWTHLQRQGWDSRFDGGAATLRFTGKAISHGESILEVGTVALLIAATVLVIIGFRRRVEWPLLVFGLGVLVMDLGSNGLMNSKARLLLPAFTLVVPVAVALAKRKPATTVATLAAMAVASGWFGAHALLIWEYAI